MYRPKYVCLCPFYGGEYIKGICCDGIDESNLTVRKFNTEEEKIEYIKENCIHEIPEDCPIFQILISKFS